MASAGVNLAITKDGEPYNKLQRPDDYLTSTTPLRPPLPAAPRPEPHLAKRKRDRDYITTNKRVRGQHGLEQLAREAPLRECGTRSRLPGVDDEDSLSDSSMSEALAYLRSVRSEALTIPPVLVAPTRERDRSDDDQQELNSNTFDAQRSVYEDGVWIAIDDEDEEAYDDYGWDEGNYNLDPQESCYVLLLRQFQSLRHKLKTHDVEKLSSIVETSEEKAKVAWALRTKQDWLDTIAREYPVLKEVCQMHERTLFHGLYSCAFSLSQSCTISHQTSCWAWTLLALIGDVGTLDNERMSNVRDLGVQAVQLGVRLRESTVYSQCQRDEVAGEQDLSFGTKETKGNDGEGVAEKIGSTNSGDLADMLLAKGVEEIGKVDVPPIEEFEVMEKVDVPSVGETEAMEKADMPLVEEIKEVENANHDQHDLAHDERNGQDPDRDVSESDADMSISDNGHQWRAEAETEDLEQARGRLLAQLGDRLVQPLLPSRADAERLREQMRNHEPQKATNQQATIVPSRQGPDGIDPEAAAAKSIWNTRVTIDMILTVVAECYGQRDLLKFREAW